MKIICPISASITQEEAAKAFSNRDLARFHFFNPNGICAEWRNLSDKLLAFGRGYDAFGDTSPYYSQMSDLSAFDVQRVNSITLQTSLKLIRRTIERGNAFLAENGAA